jgi:formylglycine-generating enzyme required for sulfatase activity
MIRRRATRCLVGHPFPAECSVQRHLVEIMTRRPLNALERFRLGRLLAQRGDPRFRGDAWNLPDEPLLGFVEIDAGEFGIGSDPPLDPETMENEVPLHRLELPRYYIGRYPVTVAQFRAFASERGFPEVHNESLAGPANATVVWVSWFAALEYCDWLTTRLRLWDGTPQELQELIRRMGWIVSLPSEAEWEKAARGPTGWIYPWGPQFDYDRANAFQSGLDSTSAVGAFPSGASPYQVEDMSGNVWEWTRSLYQPYPYRPDDGREDLSASSDHMRVLRGGSYYSHAKYVRCATRHAFYPVSRDKNTGFRLALTPPTALRGVGRSVNLSSG